MKPDDRQIDDSTQNHRSWFRWHWSSCILAVLAASLFSLIAIPGQQIKISWSVIEHREFGWPAIYLVQIPEGKKSLIEDPLPFTWAMRKRGQQSSDDRFWSDPQSWELFGDHPQMLWNCWALALNLGILSSVALVVGASAEFRRRRRKKFWQLSVLDLLFLTLIATPIGIHQNRIRTARKQIDIIQELWERESARVDVYSDQPLCWSGCSIFAVHLNITPNPATNQVLSAAPTHSTPPSR